MAEELKLNIIGDASKLKGELDKAGKNVISFSDKIGKIGKVVAVAGAAVTAAFTAIVLKTADVGDQFDKMSLRTGIAVEDLSALAYAADITGTDIGGLEVGLKFLTAGMDDAEKGTGLAKEAFEELGISVVDIEGNLRPTVDVLKEAATKIAAIENPTKQAALAMDLFGARSGPQLIPFLKMGGDGIEELMKKAEDLGIVISTEAATAAADFTDRMTDLKGSLAGAGRMIGDTLIPAITPLIEKAVEMVGKVKEWVEENKPLVEGIVKWGAGLGIALAILGPILVILPSLITGVTMLSGAFLPFAATAAIVLGFKKLSEYMGDVKIKAFELSSGLKEMGLDTVGTAITEVEGIIADLTTELEEADKGFNLFGITIKNQDVNIDRLKQVIKDYNVELGLLKERKDELTKAEEAGIDVAEEMAKVDEEAAKITAKLTEEQTKQAAALKALTAEKELENAQTEITNKLYELTLTPMENQKRLLDELKKSYEDKGIEQEIVNEWYGKEIIELNKLNEKQEDHIDIMEEVARVTKSVEDAIYELTHEPYEVKIKEINERYDDYIKVIKDSTLSTLAQETAIRNINIARDLEIDGVDKLTKAEKENEKQKDELADAYVDIKDRILELKNPRAAAIKALDDEKQRQIDLGIEIGIVNEWYDAEILKLGEAGTAFTKFGEIAWEALKKVSNYIVDELTPAIENFFFGIEDYESDWEGFWEGLWKVLKTYISNMITKLLIAIPLMLIWNVLTGGGLNWKTFWLLWGALGFEKGGEVKGYAAGGETDTVPAMLTPGEYVIAKPMTDFIKQFKAIPGNLIGAISGGFQTPTPAFAGGGSVGYSNISSGDFGGTSIYVDIHDNRIANEVDIKHLATKVSDEIVRKLNGRKRY